ncbi:hypothetical protein F5Y17DRAFT_34523 [Xylariaceae sp. FL0594]|nr:hypothetical protein F5Y17DRAFT_34523 [Xylariaceae sp. FL0594]
MTVIGMRRKGSSRLWPLVLPIESVDACNGACNGACVRGEALPQDTYSGSGTGSRCKIQVGPRVQVVSVGIQGRRQGRGRDN